MPVETIRWLGGVDGHVRMIDQTKLPLELVYMDVRTVDEMVDGIKRLCVRGAPAIGIAGAMGVVLGVQSAGTPEEFRAALDDAAARLAASRPTAVNLFWALDRMKRLRVTPEEDVAGAREAFLAEAQAILREDEALCRGIGRWGATLIGEGEGVLTHCNAGGLGTSGYGTALAVLFTAHEAGRQFRVFADETRPLLQGARLTTWELLQAGIDTTLICDDMAGWVMKQGKVQKIVVGADRIAANGDTANKIGTYALAVMAKHHGIPFYIAAPSSTFDLSIPDGASIPIEERAESEVTEPYGCRTAPEGVRVYNPAFDVTPAELITGIITEKGVIQPPTTETIAVMIGRE